MKGAPMLSKAGAKTVDDNVIFHKGTGKPIKDQFGNEIESELKQARLQRESKGDGDRGEYVRPEVD